MENVSDKSKPSMSVIEKIGTVVFFISFLPGRSRPRITLADKVKREREYSLCG